MNAFDGANIESEVESSAFWRGQRCVTLWRHWLAACRAKCDRRELARSTLRQYESMVRGWIATKLASVPVFRLAPSDFSEWRKMRFDRAIPTTMRSEVFMLRSVFQWAVRMGYLESLPCFGDAMAPVSLTTIRRTLSNGPRRVFTAAQCEALVGCAGDEMRAAILLGLNGGYGNMDVGRFRFSLLDSRPGWLCDARRKTGVQRRFPLWERTRDALSRLRSVESEFVFREWLDPAQIGRPRARRFSRIDGDAYFSDRLGQVFRTFCRTVLLEIGRAHV